MTYLKDLRYKKCHAVPKVLDEVAFCPVEREKYWTLFDPKRKKIAKNRISKSKTKLVNLHLDESEGLKDWASKDFQTIVFDLATKHCPLVFEVNHQHL